MPRLAVAAGTGASRRQRGMSQAARTQPTPAHSLTRGTSQGQRHEQKEQAGLHCTSGRGGVAALE